MNSTVIHTTEDQFATAVSQLASIPEDQWATIELSGKISATRFKELGTLLGKTAYSCHLCFDCRNVTGFSQIPSGTFDDFAFRGEKRIDVFAAGSAIQKVQGDLPRHGCFVISQLDIRPDLLQFIKEGDLMPQLVFKDDMWLTSDGKVLLDCAKQEFEITVPDGVEKIAPWALTYSASVCIVHLPDSVHELLQQRQSDYFRFITGNFDELSNTPDYIVWDAATEPVCHKVDDNLSYWISKDGTIFYLAQPKRDIKYFQIPDGVKTITSGAIPGYTLNVVEYPDSVEKAYSYADPGVTICNTNLMPADDDNHTFWDKAKGPHCIKSDDEQSTIWISKDGTHLFRYELGEEVKNAVIPEGVVTIEPDCMKTAGWRSKLNLVTLAESVSEDTRRSLAKEECFLWGSERSLRDIYITGLPRIEGNFLKDAAPSNFGNGRKKEYDAFTKSAAFSAVFEGIPKPVIRYYFYTVFELLPEKLFEEWPELKDVRAASKELAKKAKEAAAASAKTGGKKTAAATVQESITDNEWIIDAKKLAEAEYAPEKYSGKTFTLKPLNLSVKANLKRLSQWLSAWQDMGESRPAVTLDFSVSGITELPLKADLDVTGITCLILPEGFTRIEEGSLTGSLKNIVHLPDSMEFISNEPSYSRYITWATDSEEFRKNNPKLPVVPKKTKPYYKVIEGGAELIISKDESIVYDIRNNAKGGPIHLPQTVKSIELQFECNYYTKDVYCPESLEQFQDATGKAKSITFFSNKPELFPEGYTVFPSDSVFENGLWLNAGKTVVYAIRAGYGDIVIPETVTAFSTEAFSTITEKLQKKIILKNASLLDENTVQTLGDSSYVFGLGERYTKNNLARLKETVWPGTNPRNKPPKLFSDVRRSKEVTALFDGVPFKVAYSYFKNMEGTTQEPDASVEQYYPQLADVQRLLAKKETVQKIQDTAAQAVRDASSSDFTGSELTCSYQEMLLTNLKSTADTFKLTLTGKMKNVDIENVFKFFVPFNGTVELDLTGVTGLTTFRNTKWPDYIEKLKFPAGVTNTGKFDNWKPKIKEILLPSTMETLDNAEIPAAVLAWSENEILTNNYFRVFRPGYRTVDEKGFVINTLRNALVGYEGPESEDTTLVLPAVETILDFSYPCAEKITEVVIPEGVKCIKRNVFAGNTAYKNLKFIKMPSSLETIEDYAIAKFIIIEVPDSYMGQPRSIGPIISGNPELLSKASDYLKVWDKSREPYCTEDGLWLSKDGKHLFDFPGYYQNCSCYNQVENKITLPQGLESMEREAIDINIRKGAVVEFPETFSDYDTLTFIASAVIVNEPDRLKNAESWKERSECLWEKGAYCTKEGFWLSKDGKTLYRYDVKQDEITIPDGVTHVAKRAFSYMESYHTLKRLSFPSSIELVEDTGNYWGFLDVPGSKFPENYVGYSGTYIRGIRCAPDCNFVDVINSGWMESWDSSRKTEFRRYKENEKFRKVFTGIPEHVIRYWAKNKVEDFCEEFKQDWPQLVDVEGAAAK